MSLKDVHIQNPRVRNYVAQHDKRDSSDVITLNPLRQGDCVGLSGWAQCNHEGPYNREAGGAEFGRDLRMKEKIGVMCFEEGGKNEKILLEAEKGKETDFPPKPSEGMSFC